MPSRVWKWWHIALVLAAIVLVGWRVVGWMPGSRDFGLARDVEIGPEWQTFSRSSPLLRLKRDQRVLIKLPSDARATGSGLETSAGQSDIEVRLVFRDGRELDLGRPGGIYGAGRVEFLSFVVPRDTGGVWFSAIKVRSSTKIVVPSISWNCFSLTS